MICRLCRKAAPLCDSHVVPEFLYKPIYDEAHRLFPMVGGKRLKSPALQKGLRERLLCTQCEGLLAKHEKYVSELFSGDLGVSCRKPGDNIEITDLDYTHIRICFLSVLWRMSVAAHQAWRTVQLGPHEDRLREMILAEDPGEPTHYAFFCVAPVIDGEFSPDLMLGPDPIHRDGGRYYRMILAGLAFSFFVSSTPFPEEQRSLLITRAGRWLIPVRDASTIGFLREYATRIVQHHEPET